MLNKSILYICLTLILAACAGFILGLQPKELPKYDEFPVYPLKDLSGQTYSFETNKMKLITFFYSRCPDVCPITINDLTKLYEELRKNGLLENDIDIITVTLDPEHDTEEVLKKYSQTFNISTKESWYFLRSTEEGIQKLTDDLGFYREETAGYWSHSTTIYLVDYKNRKRTFYQMSGPSEPLDFQKIIEDIFLLKKEQKRW